MKIKLTVVLLTFFSLAMNGQAWEQMGNTSFQRHHGIGFSLNGYGYVLTGDDGQSSMTQTFHRYTPATDTWEQLPDYPGVPRGYGIGDTWDGKLYFGFGYTPSGDANDLWEYNPTTDTFTQLPNCPCEPRAHPALVAHQDKVYVGMGSGVDGNLGDWWVYDINTQVWAQKADLPGDDRHHPYQFAIGDDIYVGSGHQYDWYKYTPSNDTWTQVANLGTVRRVAGTQFAYNGKGYVLSGTNDNHGDLPTGEFWEYDPVSDNWLELPPHPGTSRWAPASFIIDGYVYMFTGQSGGNDDIVYRFDLDGLIPTEAPDVDFAASDTESCDGIIYFTDNSTNYPDAWSWDFGDGNTSTLQNPSHQYTADGNYTVTLTATNIIGSSTEVKTAYVTIGLPAAPAFAGTTMICEGESTTLTATSADVAYWLDGNGNVLETGNTFDTPSLTASTTYYLESRAVKPVQEVGPASSVGSGGYHNTGYRGTVDFEAFAGFTILSVWVDAGSTGNRLIDLEQNGAVIASVTVPVNTTGGQRIDLNLDVPGPGYYSLAAESVDLYRNDSGLSYPYTINDLVALTGSSAGTDYYYYFYEWEVQELPCISEQIAVEVTVEECINTTNTELAEVFHIQPNPNNGSFTIELEGSSHQQIKIAVIDIFGQVIFQNAYAFHTGQLTTRINLDNVASGTYFVQVSAADQVSYQKVMVK